MNHQLNARVWALCFLLFTSSLQCFVQSASASVRRSGAQRHRLHGRLNERKRADNVAVMNVVNRLFESMQAKQVDVLRGLFIPEGRLVSTITREGQPTVRLLSLDDFIKLVAEAKEPFRERMFDPEVRVQGDMATAWGRYDFHVGARLTNCGFNSFQLLRTKEGWKIVNIASTIITQGCQESK